MALFEMIMCDESMAEFVAGGAKEESIARMAEEHGRPRLIDDALDKLRSGVTSVDEVLANVMQW